MQSGPSASQPQRAATFVALRLTHFALLFVVTVILARALGPAERARYALPLAVATIAWALGHLSLENAAARILARGEAELPQLVGHLSAAVLILGSVAALGTLAFGLAARGALAGASSTTLLLAAAAVPFMFAGQFAGHMLLLLGALRSYSIGYIVATLIQLAVLLVALATTHLDAAGAMAIALVGFACSAVLLGAALGSRLGAGALKPRVSTPQLMNLVRAGVAMHPAIVAQQLGTRVDLLVVGAVVSARQTGLYSLALTLAESSYAASQNLALSALRGQTEGTAEEASEYTIRFTRGSLQLAWASAIVACAVSYPFIVFAFGGAWRGSVLPLAILVAANLAFAVEAPVRTLVLRVGRPSSVSLLACGGVLLNVALTIPLLLTIGISGAAIGSVAAYWTYTVLLGRTFSRLTGRSVTELIDRPRPRVMLALVLSVARRRQAAGDDPLSRPSASST